MTDHRVLGALQSDRFLIARFARSMLQILDDWTYPSIGFDNGQAFGIPHAQLLQMNLKD